MRVRSAASVVLAALVLAGTTACTFMTPQATTKQYDPSDGIGTTVGEVQVRNALLLSEDGETASLLVSIANESDKGVQVNVQYETADNTKVDESVFLNAGAVKSLGAGDDPLVLTGLDAQPGSLFPIFFQYDDVTGKQLMVPVLDGSEPHYSDLLPTTEQ